MNDSSPATGVSVSWRRVATCLGIGGVLVVALAAMPALGRSPRTPFPVSIDGLAHTAVSKHAATARELARRFADLSSGVDPFTLQRPAYPSLAEIEARLATLPGWSSAVFYDLQAARADLRAAGVADDVTIRLIRPRPMLSRDFPIQHWSLVLLDESRQHVAQVTLPVPALGAERFGFDDLSLALAPPLDQRMPCWPAAALIRRAGT